MSSLCSLLKNENVLLGLAPGSKKRIFEQAAQTLSLLYGVQKKLVFDGLFARERLGSTYLGNGLALPHCRIAGLKEPCALFIRLHGTIEEEEEPIHSFFFLIAPEEACEDHLKILSSIAGIFSDEKLREELFSAPNSESFCSLIRKWDASHAAVPSCGTSD